MRHLICGKLSDTCIKVHILAISFCILPLLARIFKFQLSAFIRVFLILRNVTENF